MRKNVEGVPRYSYPAAVVAGLLCIPLSFVLTAFLSLLLDAKAHAFGPTMPFALALCYGAAGAVFGLFWPEKTWRWGVWLSAVPVCLISFLGVDALTFLILASAMFVPACACAYVIARVHLKYVEVN